MTLTIELPDDLEAILKARANSKGETESGFVQKVLEQFLTLPPDDRKAAANPEPRPLSARIREIWDDMPDDVRAEYPEGGAYQIDHHLYSLPKR